MNIKDVARIAGVGVSTVSRVINNRSEVKDETRERILRVIEENNYVVNNSARSLKIVSSKNIGVLLDGRYNPFFYEIINSISAKIQELGYSMIIKHNNTSESDLVIAKEFVLEKKLAGLICIGVDFTEIKVDVIRSINVPMVLLSSNIDKDISKNEFSSINIDDLKSAYDATKLFLNYGHKNIAIISARGNDKVCGSLRLKGYKKALIENNISINPEFIEYGEYSFKSGYESMKALLKNKKRPSAVFIISDIMAIGAARACLDEGINIPNDISIIGFDGIENTEYYNPPIATVKQPFKYMGVEGVELLTKLIKDEIENKHIVLPTELITRASIKKI